MTFSSTSWRSLSHLKGSLNHPKKVTKNCQDGIFSGAMLVSGRLLHHKKSMVRNHAEDISCQIFDWLEIFEKKHILAILLVTFLGW